MKLISRRKLQNIIAVVLLLVCITALVPEIASASDTYFTNSTEKWVRYSKADYTVTTGILWWKKTYNCKAYIDNGDWYDIFHGPTTETGWEYKNNNKTDIVISQTKALSISAQTTATLNADVELEDAGIKSGFGGSISATRAQTWQISSTTTRTVDKSEPNGYYNYCVCMNLYYFKVTGTPIGTIKFWAPKSEPYRAIIYSRTCSYDDATKNY